LVSIFAPRHLTLRANGAYNLRLEEDGTVMWRMTDIEGILFVVVITVALRGLSE
jgi:hypothetical protein